MLYIKSLELILLMIGSLYHLTNISFLPPLSPWQPLFYSLFLSFPFQNSIYISDIIQYLYFSVWLISLSIVLSGYPCCQKCLDFLLSMAESSYSIVCVFNYTHTHTHTHTHIFTTFSLLINILMDTSCFHVWISASNAAVTMRVRVSL